MSSSSSKDSQSFCVEKISKLDVTGWVEDVCTRFVAVVGLDVAILLKDATERDGAWLDTRR